METISADGAGEMSSWEPPPATAPRHCGHQCRAWSRLAAPVEHPGLQPWSRCAPWPAAARCGWTPGAHPDEHGPIRSPRANARCIRSVRRPRRSATGAKIVGSADSARHRSPRTLASEVAEGALTRPDYRVVAGPISVRPYGEGWRWLQRLVGAPRGCLDVVASVKRLTGLWLMWSRVRVGSWYCVGTRV